MTIDLKSFVVFCPVCCSAVTPKGWGTHPYDCTDCGTEFAVVLREEAVRDHGH